MSVPWHPLSLPDRCKVLLAMVLVKLGKLQYDQFSETELNELIIGYFPHELALPVPIGKGKLSVISGQLSMPETTNRLQLELFCALEIRVLANPIYRAHVVITVSALPLYVEDTKLLTIQSVKVDNIELIQDEYALLSDTSKLIDTLSPVPISGLLGSPIKSALNMLTAGRSSSALQYLQIYVGGSKQQVLDYHRYEIENHVIQAVNQADIHVVMQADDWRQNLFARLGKTVCVEERELRFYF